MSPSTGPIGKPPLSGVLTYDPAFPTGRHTDGSDYLLADGHAKYFKGAAVSPGAGPGSSANQSGNYACTTDLLSANNFAATFSTL